MLKVNDIINIEKEKYIVCGEVNGGYLLTALTTEIKPVNTLYIHEKSSYIIVKPVEEPKDERSARRS